MCRCFFSSWSVQDRNKGLSVTWASIVCHWGEKVSATSLGSFLKAPLDGALWVDAIREAQPSSPPSLPEQGRGVLNQDHLEVSTRELREQRGWCLVSRAINQDSLPEEAIPAVMLILRATRWLLISRDEARGGGTAGNDELSLRS